MADDTLRFDIIGDALTAVSAFHDTGDAAKDAAKDVDQANKSIDQSGKSADQSERSTGRMTDALTALAAVGSHVGSVFGTGGGGGGGRGVFGGLAGGIGPGILGVNALKASIVGLGGAVVGMLPALLGIGAGLAVIGGGFAILMKTNKAFAKDVDDTFKGIEGVLKNAVTPLIKPLEQGFQQLGTFVRQIGPELKDVFAAAGPLVAPLIHGLTGLVGGLLPGLLTILKAAAPAMAAFGSILAHIGSALGQMFSAAAPALTASSQLLKGLFGIVDTLLPVLIKLGSTLATALAPAFASMTGAINALLPVFGAIGKVIGAFAGAVIGDLGSALGAVATLLKGIAPSLNILGKALAQVFTVLENTGVFAIFGDALENIAKPLAQLINVLVADLAPVLPVIIGLIGQLSAVFVSLASAGLTVIIKALTAIVTAVPPPVLQAIAFAFTAWAIATKLVSGAMSVLGLVTEETMAKVAAMTIVEKLQAIGEALVTAATGAWEAVTAALDAVLMANPIALIVVAIAALVIGIIELVRHWKDVTDVFKSGWHDIENIFKDGINLIRSVVDDFVTFIRTHWQMLATIIATVLLGPVTGLVAFIATHWQEFRSLTSRLISDVTGFFERLPGEILRALATLPGEMLGLGRDIIDGLLHGIESGVGAVIGEIEHLGSDVSSAFASVIHALSPSKVFEEHGRNIVRGLVQGISSEAPSAIGAIRSLGTSMSGASVSSASGGGSGQWLEAKLELQPTGVQFIDELMESAKLYIRGHGGGGPNSVQIALGQSH